MPASNEEALPASVKVCTGRQGREGLGGRGWEQQRLGVLGVEERAVSASDEEALPALVKVCEGCGVRVCVKGSASSYGTALLNVWTACT